MNAEVINRFVSSSQAVLNDYFNLPVGSGGPPSVMGSGASLQPVSVIVSVFGDLSGQFVLGYSEEVALNIARSMMMNPDYPELDDLCISALSELGNIIGGMTATELTAMGFECDIAPPSVVRGEHVTMSVQLDKILVLPLKCRAGEFYLYIALKESGHH
ncbi:chemotaxis protein CheX [bacterium]|nr:chemotaxis protein CheX [bacterium]